MTASVFDLFKLGVGPSSSHTMGPMTAANRFLARLCDAGRLPDVVRVEIKLYASLALTGRGHATDRAVLLGLMGFEPATLDPDVGEAALLETRATQSLFLNGEIDIGFDEAKDIVWLGHERLPQHPNGLTFTAYDRTNFVLAERTYFSVGGGFVRDESEMGRNAPPEDGPAIPFPFESGADLLQRAADAGLTIAGVMGANELARMSQGEMHAGLERIYQAMEACIDRGMRQDGTLPGGLSVKRRARQIHQTLQGRMERQISDPLAAMDFVNLWAMAVNEENAAGGRVVTAPTNGAAGLVPAVLRFFVRFYQGTPEQVRTFLLTAAAIGALYKRNASISGAEVGCQGEVGVACSMAAAGLCAALGGTNAQIENAAEIGMEHNLGLTCDPIGGLVQIPCIERNAMGAIKAIDAARLALLGDGQHSVSLDKVIATMKRTGEDMNEIYKETSMGGLAVGLSVNRVEC
ncbi:MULTISPECIES: L-serine ammonia-lyase [unclassified Caulobacter]|uniref:L-serine ammonia-lyase n=1 Tax=unclassified Caulobacter TaxID=2648921 RepID=UPI000D39743E|nr:MULTISPECIES: L-serine ammonia-lyase [unclassified Caulobacter]PTS86808.1 L-serine ammonia-lyase [Caulobacter sp. HMWF009]PTT11652.1 L-serine ammonia-lyase [Caulobacter sp. HMWF025]PTT76999.1 L-serine ammonia-lyase [Pseudomonas sp. HMWF010]